VTPSRVLLWAVTILTAMVGDARTEEFSNSFAVDAGRKEYRVSVTGNDERVDLSGSYATSLHATWMLRLWEDGFESPGFLGGLGLAYGFYEEDDLRLQVFEMRADFGPAFEPVSWLRLGMQAFGGIGYHDLRVPQAVYDLTGVAGVGNLGFSYGANGFLTCKVHPRLHLSGQIGFRGMYVSYGVFEDGDLERGITSSTIGLLAGASIDFAF
jgi:hypothetical protein